MIVSEWLEGTPLSRIIADGTQEQRDRAGHLLARPALLRSASGPGCCTPTRTRATSGCSTTAGSASSTSARPRGCPTAIPSRSAGCCGWALAGKADEVLADLRAEGFVRPNVEVDAQGVLDYLRPLLEPLASRPLPLHPRLDAGAGGPDRRPAQRGQPARPAAEPAAGLPADPPGDDRLDRRALPARAPPATYRGVLEEWLPGFAE